MKTIELSTASRSLSDYACEFGKQTVILTLNGKAIAAVVAFEEQDTESLSLLNNPDFLSIIENAKQEFEAGKTLSLEQMKQEILLGD